MWEIGKQGRIKKYGKEFKEFITKGNVISLAVGVVLGGAFQAVINSAVNDVFLPIIGMFTKEIDFSKGFLDLSRLMDPGQYARKATAALAQAEGHVVVTYGTLITAIINFLIIGLVVFAIVKSINSVGDMGKKVKKRAIKGAPAPAPAPPTTRECPYCISEISIKATRCPNCTSQLPLEEEEETEAGESEGTTTEAVA